EGSDPRVRAAAARLEQLGLGRVQLLEAPAPSSLLPPCIRLLRSRHQERFPSDAAAAAALEHPLTLGACVVGLGRADVMVGGATYPSGDTIRAALWAVGPAPGITTVSGAFYMVKEGTGLARGRLRQCAGLSRPGQWKHRLQAGAAAGRVGGDRTHPPGIGAARGRPVARRHGRRYCGHGGGRRPSSGGGVMSFSLTKDKRGVVVVGVDGQLIVGNRQELKQKVLESLDGGAKQFVIDFTRTGYIDSSGLGVLVSLSKKIREQGGDLRLAGLNEDR